MDQSAFDMQLLPCMESEKVNLKGTHKYLIFVSHEGTQGRPQGGGKGGHGPPRADFGGGMAPPKIIPN